MKERIGYIDLVKFVAIYLVIWGHALTQMMPNDLGQNEVYLAIYSFHMPLFMMVSGLFAANSFRLSPVELISKKFRQLVLPSLTFGLVWYVAQGLVVEGTFPEYSFSYPLEYVLEWKALLKHEAAAYWFLKSLFVCYVLVYACHKFGGVLQRRVASNSDGVCNMTGWGLVGLSFLVLCYIQRCEVTMFKAGNMLPFFCLGIVLKDRLMWVKECAGLLFLIAAAVFVICYAGYSLDYAFAAYFFKEIGVDAFLHFAYYFVTALAGSVMVFSGCAAIADRIGSRRVMVQIGTQTLGVYLWQKILLEVLLPRFWQVEMPMWQFNYVFTPLLSLVMLGLCYKVTMVTRKFI